MFVTEFDEHWKYIFPKISKQIYQDTLKCIGISQAKTFIAHYICKHTDMDIHIHAPYANKIRPRAYTNAFGIKQHCIYLFPISYLT